MAVETVRVYSVDQSSNALPGVLVRVFDATGTTFITQGYTALVGADAYVEFSLDGNDPPVNYTIRMAKTGVAFDGSLGDDSKTPQLIAIYSPPVAPGNGFTVQGETFPLQPATDPRLCRASGYFRDAAGGPLHGLYLTLINQFKPAIVDGRGILGGKIELKTDEDGFVSVDLFRSGIYRAMVESIQAAEASPEGAIAFSRDIRVPDQAYANLVDLLFPVVSEITWDPATLTVATGETLDVVPTIKCSDGRTLIGAAVEDVLYTTEDLSVANVAAEEGKIVILGVGPGTTHLVAARKDQTIITVPVTSIVGSPVDIVVT